MKISLWNESSFHDNVKYLVANICRKLGFETREEYKGKGWRADVFVVVNGRKYAIEIQTSLQSLNKTLERQQKYISENVTGCWLFVNEPKQDIELEKLPLFKLNNKEPNNITVSLKDRKELPIKDFIKDFLNDNIKFCNTLNTSAFEIRYVKMDCWKCNTENYFYYIGGFVSNCNAKIFHGDIELWNSDKLIFHSLIQRKVIEHNDRSLKLPLATIKERYSNMTASSYMSFGCKKCDSIFGDWYIRNAVIDTWYGDGIADKFMIENNKVKFENVIVDIPHWCHPGNKKFCE